MVKDRRVDWKTELFRRFLKFTPEVMVFKESKVVRILIKTAKNQLPFGQIETEESLIKKIRKSQRTERQSFEKSAKSSNQNPVTWQTDIVWILAEKVINRFHFREDRNENFVQMVTHFAGLFLIFHWQ